MCCSKVVLVKCATPGGVPQAKHLAGERIAISLSNHKLFYFNKQTLEIYSFFLLEMGKNANYGSPNRLLAIVVKKQFICYGPWVKHEQFPDVFFTIIGHHNCRMLMIFDEVCMDYYKKCN